MASLKHLTTAAYIPPLQHKNKYNSCQITAQSYRSHQGCGRSEIVNDENLGVLRKRIEEVKNKERCRLAGWDYLRRCAPEKNDNNNNYKLVRSKMEKEWAEFVRMMGVVAATFGLTIFSCTCCLCIVALFVHPHLI